MSVDKIGGNGKGNGKESAKRNGLSTNPEYPKLQISEFGKDWYGWIDWPEKYCTDCRTPFKLQVCIIDWQPIYCGAVPQCECRKKRGITDFNTETFKEVQAGIKKADEVVQYISNTHKFV